MAEAPLESAGETTSLSSSSLSPPPPVSGASTADSETLDARLEAPDFVDILEALLDPAPSSAAAAPDFCDALDAARDPPAADRFAFDRLDL